MSIKTVQIVHDDIDGSEGAETVGFAWDGLAYEIDLNSEHKAEFESMIQPWIEKARRARGGRGASGRRAASSVHPLRGRTQSLTDKGFNARSIREWAQKNGVEVNDHGRIPEVIIQQYEAAQKEPTPRAAAKRSPAKKAPAKKAASRRPRARAAKEKEPAASAS